MLLLWFYYYYKAEVKIMMWWWCLLRWRCFTHILYTLLFKEPFRRSNFKIRSIHFLRAVVLLYFATMTHTSAKRQYSFIYVWNGEGVKESISSPTFAFVQRKRQSFLHTDKKVALYNHNEKNSFVMSDSPNEFMIKILSIVVRLLFFFFFFHRLVTLHAHSLIKFICKNSKSKRKL